MAQGFSARVYGTIASDPPYLPNAQGAIGTETPYTSTGAQVANFSGVNVNVWPISNPGLVMNGVSCYAVIELPATGLNVHGDKFVVQNTVAQIATLRNA